MPVESPTSKITYVIAAGQVDYPFPYKFFSKTDLKVYTGIAGTETLLVLDYDYTITPDADDYPNGATVQLITPQTAGNILVIVREMALLQTMALPGTGRVNTEAIEQAFDKLVMICQQLNEKLTRAIQVSLTGVISRAVTFTDAGDTVGLNAHGIPNGTTVYFTSIVSTTGIVINTAYYVVGTTLNTFQVSATLGGSPLALTTNGTGVIMYIGGLGLDADEVLISIYNVQADVALKKTQVDSLITSNVYGVIPSCTCAVNLLAFNLVNCYMDTVLKIRKADANLGYPANGMVIASASSGNVVTVYRAGVATGFTGLTPGLDVYLSTAGGITQDTATAGTLCIQPVGFAISTTSIFFYPSQPIML